MYRVGTIYQGVPNANKQEKDQVSKKILVIKHNTNLNTIQIFKVH